MGAIGAIGGLAGGAFGGGALSAIGSIASLAFSAFSSFGGQGGSAGSVPNIPTYSPPPVTPSVDNSAEELQAEADKAAKDAAGKKGSQQTILTSGQGVEEEKITKKLLGD